MDVEVNGNDAGEVVNRGCRPPVDRGQRHRVEPDEQRKIKPHPDAGSNTPSLGSVLENHADSPLHNIGDSDVHSSSARHQALSALASQIDELPL